MTTNITANGTYFDYIELTITTPTNNIHINYKDIDWTDEDPISYNTPTYSGNKYNYSHLLAYTFNDIVEDIIANNDDTTANELRNIWNNTSEANKQALREQWEQWAIHTLELRISTLQNQINEIQN